MKRYIVFKGMRYYPGGGAEDILLITDDKAKAILAALDLGLYEFAQIWDHEAGTMIYEEWNG